jgi:hypothetical protein
MTFAIGLGAGPLGLGALTAANLPFLTGGVAFVLRTGLGLLKGESASAAVGGALKTAVVGWLTGKVISSVMGPVFDHLIKLPQPAIIHPEIIERVTDAQGNGWEHVKLDMHLNPNINPRSPFDLFNGDSFSSGKIIKMDVVTSPEMANFLQKQANIVNKYSNHAFKLFKSGDQEGAMKMLLNVPARIEELKSHVIDMVNDPENINRVNAFKSYDAVIEANKGVQAATKAFNDVYLNATQGVAVATAAGVGGLLATDGPGPQAPYVPPAAPPAAPPKTEGRLQLTNILAEMLNEAELTDNQKRAVDNLKGKLSKEIVTFIKDVAKTFKVKGSSTKQLLDGLRNIPNAKSAVNIIDSLMTEFPKYKLEFPKDVTMDAKEAETPPTDVTKAPDNTGGADKPPAGGGADKPNAGGGGGSGETNKPNAGGGGGSGETNKPNAGGGGGSGETNKPNAGDGGGSGETNKPNAGGGGGAGSGETNKPNAGGGGGSTPPGTTPPGTTTVDGLKVSPNFIKHLTALKSSPLFSENLQSRIQTLFKQKPNDKFRDKYAREFISAVKRSIISGKAQYIKMLGNPSAVRKSMNITESMNVSDITGFSKQLTAVMPNIFGLLFELRQMYSKKNPNNITSKKPAAPAPTTAAPAPAPTTVAPSGVSLNEAGDEITVQDIKNVKVLLSRLIELSPLVKSINPNKLTKATLNPLVLNLLDIGDAVANDNKKGVGKINKTVDVAFQGIDILGGDKKDIDKKDEKPAGEETPTAKKLDGGPVVNIQGTGDTSTGTDEKPPKDDELNESFKPSYKDFFK